jgi:hypothetical protein
VLYWIVVIGLLVLFIGGYTWLFLYARKRQKAFDEQYNALKERRELFVLSKKIVRERPKSGWLRFARFKTYQVTARVPVSQSIRGIQVNRMQVMTFHTTKSEWEKIQPNHKYKMDIAGNYIGYVVAPPPTKQKDKDKGGKTKQDRKAAKK